MPSQIIINSTNVVNSGELGVGNAGVLSIVAKTFNNEFGSLAAGGVNTGGATSQFVSEQGIETETDPLDTTGRADNDPPYFVNPPGVYDLVWGATNGTQTTTGINLAALAGELPSTPPMNSGFRGLFGLTGLNAGGFGGAIGEYASYLWTTNLSPTNVYYEIVPCQYEFPGHQPERERGVQPQLFQPDTGGVGGRPGAADCHRAILPDDDGRFDGRAGHQCRVSH